MNTSFEHITIGVATICLLLLLSGCTTVMLVDRAEGGKSVVMNIKAVKINSAYMDKQNGTVNVCMNVVDNSINSVSEIMLSIPLSDKERWIIADQSQDSSSFNDTPASARHIEFMLFSSDITDHCIAEGRPLRIVDATPESNIEHSRISLQEIPTTLPDDIKDAVYTINKNQYPVEIGYISLIPLSDNAYSINISTSDLYITRPQSEPRRWLYAFTPITLAIDIAMVVAFIVMEIAH